MNFLLDLGHPRVIAARRKFVSNKHKKRMQLTFNQLLSHFDDPEISMKKIAEVAQVKKQAVYMLFDRVFAPLGIKGHLNIKDLCKRSLKPRQFEFDAKSPAGILARLAKGRVKTINPIITKSRNTHKHHVLLNDKLCSAHISRFIFITSGGKKYFRFSIMVKQIGKVDFLSFISIHNQETIVYNIPSKDIEIKTSKRVLNFYIPTEPETKNRRGTNELLKWQFYKNSWVLINK